MATILIFLISIANAATFKTSETDQGTTFLNFNERGYALFYGFTFLIWASNEIYRNILKSKDKTQDKLDYLVESNHRMEERLRKIESSSISHRDIQSMIRDEISWANEFKRKQ